jgi:hypothetical protein
MPRRASRRTGTKPWTTCPPSTATTQRKTAAKRSASLVGAIGASPRQVRPGLRSGHGVICTCLIPGERRFGNEAYFLAAASTGGPGGSRTSTPGARRTATARGAGQIPARSSPGPRFRPRRSAHSVRMTKQKRPEGRALDRRKPASRPPLSLQLRLFEDLHAVVSDLDKACARHRVGRCDRPGQARPARLRDGSTTQRNPPACDRQRAILEGSQHVIPLEIGVVGQNLVNRHSSGQKLQDVRHRILQTADHRPSLTDVRVRSDSVETGHTPSVRQQPAIPAEVPIGKEAWSTRLPGPDRETRNRRYRALHERPSSSENPSGNGTRSVWFLA